MSGNCDEEEFCALFVLHKFSSKTCSITFLCDQKFIAESRTFALIFQFSYVKYLFPATNGHRFVSIFFSLKHFSCSTWDWKKEESWKALSYFFLFFSLYCKYSALLWNNWKLKRFSFHCRWKDLKGRPSESRNHAKNSCNWNSWNFFYRFAERRWLWIGKIVLNKQGLIEEGKIVQLRHYRGNNFGKIF